MPTSFAERPEVCSPRMILEPGFYPVVVEYGEWWTLYRAGCFHDRHLDIGPENFRIPLGPGGLRRASADIRLGHFDQPVDTNRILVEFDRLNLRPTNFPEALALATEFPSLQTKFPIIALMAIGKNSKGDVGVIRLDKAVDYRETKRILDWEPFEKFKSWQPGIRFAAVPIR